MKTIIKPYYFIPGNSLEKLKKGFETSLFEGLDICRIVEFEDAVKDPLDAVHDAHLKADARSVSFQFIKDARPINFALRVNSKTSGYYEDDLGFIESLLSIYSVESFPISDVIYPKVENITDLENLFHWLRDRKLYQVGIIPIIETVRGVSVVKEVAELPFLDAMFFGSNDYFFDARQFPIPAGPIHSNNYRIVLNAIAESLSGVPRKQFTLIDSVSMGLKDAAGLAETCRYLYQNYGQFFKLGKPVLNPYQLDVLGVLNAQSHLLTLSYEVDNERDLWSEDRKLVFAEAVVASYEARDLSCGAVSANTEAGANEIIAFQQYFLARDFLAERRKLDACE